MCVCVLRRGEGGREREGGRVRISEIDFFPSFLPSLLPSERRHAYITAILGEVENAACGAAKDAPFFASYLNGIPTAGAGTV